MEKKKDVKASTALSACRGCPYPFTGFLCGGSDGECTKTRMQKIKNTSKKEECAND